MDVLIRNFISWLRLDEWLSQHGAGFMVSDRVVQMLSILIGSVIVYYVGKVLIKVGIHYIIRSTARHRAWHRKDKEKREKTLVSLMRSFWRIFMVAYVIAMTANKLFLIDLSPLFASAGIVGVALGFGAQSLVKDFLAGLFIITENQYRVGDVVDIMGAAGTVERVGSRSTVIRDAEGNVHYIPNGTIQHVINKTMGYSMSRFTIHLDPASDISQVMKIINSTGKKLAREKAWRDKIIDPPKFIAVGDITGRSVEITIAGKVQPSDQWAVSSEMRRRLLSIFEREDIALAATAPSNSNTRRPA